MSRPSLRPFGVLTALVLAPAVLAVPPVLNTLLDPNGHPYGSSAASVSGDGRWAVFRSANAVVVDRTDGTRRVVSKNTATGDVALAWAPRIASGGRVVAFRVTDEGATALNGAAVANPAGGKLVAFVDRDTDADGVMDEDGAMRVVVLPNSGDDLGPDPWGIPTNSAMPIALSGDGRFVAFIAKQLDDTGWLIRLRDSDTDQVYDEVGETTTLTISTHDTTGPVRLVISADGSTVATEVAYGGFPSNQIRFYDIATTTWSVIGLGGLQEERRLVGLSETGRYALYTSTPQSGASHATRYDRQTDTAVQVDRLFDGSPSTTAGKAWALSKSGRYAVVSTGTSPVDASGFLGAGTFVYDLDAGTARGLQAVP